MQLRKNLRGGLCSLAVLACVFAPRTAEAAEQVYTGNVAAVTLNYEKDDVKSSSQAYAYVPAGENISVGHNATWKPIILVYGDYADADAVKTEAQESGFDQIAAKEEAVVMFIDQPDGGWTENDKYSLLAAVNKYSDNTDYTFDKETGLTAQEADGSVQEWYPGYSERCYVFADGSAADFVSTYIAQGTRDTVHYADVYYKPSSMYLSNVTAAPQNIRTLRESAAGLPVWLVNAKDSVKTKYEENANTVTAETSIKTDGFDKSQVLKSWDEFLSLYRRCYDVSIKITDYDKILDVTENHFQCSTGKQIEYYTFIPKGMDLTKAGTVPLVTAFHGQGSSALVMAHTSEWPEKAVQENFIYLGVNKVENHTNAEVMEMLRAYVETVPAVDKDRIYCTGFSNGSRRTLSLCNSAEYASFFAACAPMNALTTTKYEPVENLNKDSRIMPMAYFGATNSHIQELVNNYKMGFLKLQDAEEVMTYLFQRNRIAGGYTNDKTGYWGIPASDAVKVTKAESKYYPEFQAEITSVASADGNVYTKLIAGEGLIHEYSEMYTDIAWDFMKQFSGDVVFVKKAQSLSGKKSYSKTAGDKAFKLDIKSDAESSALSYKSSSPQTASVDSKGKVTVKGAGKTVITVTAAETAMHTGASCQVTVLVKPGKTAKVSARYKSPDKISVIWSKDSSAAGYYIRYSADKNFKSGVKTVHAGKNAKSKTLSSGIARSQTYYVQVRAYSGSRENPVYGSWSAAVKVNK